MFCPKCGSILIPELRKGKRVFTCSCGYKTAKLKEATIKESIKSGKTKVEIIEKRNNSEAVSMNLGIKEAKGDIVIILAQDCVPADDNYEDIFK